MKKRAETGTPPMIASNYQIPIFFARPREPRRCRNPPSVAILGPLLNEKPQRALTPIPLPVPFRRAGT